LISTKSKIKDQKSKMDSVILTIRVIPRAGRSGPAGIRDHAFLIRLNAPPVEGAANAELIDVLADLLDVPKRNVTIVSGERSRLKRVRIIGITPERARTILHS
jgi:uncharacterized protein (TIGR00251 family)